MSVINPHTGQEFTSRSLSDKQIVELVQALQMKIQLLNQQNMHMGLYVEYIVENLSQMKDAEGNQLFKIDLEAWPEWAEERYAAIQEEIAKEEQDSALAEAAETIATAASDADRLGIDLSETTSTEASADE